MKILFGKIELLAFCCEVRASVITLEPDSGWIAFRDSMDSCVLVTGKW